MNFKSEFELAKITALEVGEFLKLQTLKKINSQEGKDIKLEVDKKSEEIIIEKLTNFTQIGPDFWSRIIVAIFFFIFSQLIHLSVSGARSYGPKALLGSGTSGPGKIFKRISV